MKQQERIKRIMKKNKNNQTFLDYLYEDLEKTLHNIAIHEQFGEYLENLIDGKNETKTWENLSCKECVFIKLKRCNGHLDYGPYDCINCAVNEKGNKWSIDLKEKTFICYGNNIKRIKG